MGKISRRAFLRRAALAGSLGIASRVGTNYHIALADAPVVYKLRILHTNDHHAQLEPHTLAIQNSASSPLTRSVAGVARRKTLIDQLRAEAAPDDNILLLDSGDVFQGTLYFTLFSGQADLYFYNNLGYDAVTLGNHEFDLGQSALNAFILGANFPLLSANVEVQPGALLASSRAATDYAVPGRWSKRLLIPRGGKVIGLFGLTPVATTVLSNPGAGVSFNSNLVQIAQAEVDALRQAGASYVIGLTHVGYNVDCQLASQVRGLNAIVGGHSHSYLLPELATNPFVLEPVGVYPTLIKDPDGRNVVVTTVWKWGTWLGDMTLGFNAAGEVATLSGVIRTVWAGGLGVPARPLVAGEGPEIAPDPVFQEKIDKVYKPPITQLKATIIGNTSVLLEGDRASVRNRETNFGSLIADLMLNRVKPEGGQIAIMNGGGIDESIRAGDVSMAEVLAALPFDNTIAHVDLTGAQLVQALENAVGFINLQSPTNSAGRFAQVSGLRFTWAVHLPRGKRIISASVQAGPQYVPVNPDQTYRVVTTDFLLAGGDGYTVFTQGQNEYDTGYNLTDVLIDYIKANSPITASVDGRIAPAQRLLLPNITRSTNNNL